ncbi:MAG: hypothetical protein IPM29_00360 [Planctomycetes bacterium]|nr:hypothetical protein [Planctomycetota bacterium]
MSTRRSPTVVRRPVRAIACPARLALLALGTVAAACSFGGPLGRLDDEVVEVLDAGRPDHPAALRIERDGRVLEARVALDLAEVPAGVLAAAGRAAGADAQVVAARRGRDGGGAFYVVACELAGASIEVRTRTDGSVLEVAQPIDPAAAPQLAVGTAAGMVREFAGLDGNLAAVLRVAGAEVETFRVVHEAAGLRYVTDTTADGRLLRTVRELPCRVDLPVH